MNLPGSDDKPQRDANQDIRQVYQRTGDTAYRENQNAAPIVVTPLY